MLSAHDAYISKIDHKIILKIYVLLLAINGSCLLGLDQLNQHKVYKMSLQSYTLAQLTRLELLAFPIDWEKALIAYNYENFLAIEYSKFIAKYGIIKFIKEYNIEGTELENQFDWVICYLINEFDIK